MQINNFHTEVAESIVRYVETITSFFITEKKKKIIDIQYQFVLLLIIIIIENKFISIHKTLNRANEIVEINTKNSMKIIKIMATDNYIQ